MHLIWVILSQKSVPSPYIWDESYCHWSRYLRHVSDMSRTSDRSHISTQFDTSSYIWYESYCHWSRYPRHTSDMSHTVTGVVTLAIHLIWVRLSQKSIPSPYIWYQSYCHWSRYPCHTSYIIRAVTEVYILVIHIISSCHCILHHRRNSDIIMSLTMEDPSKFWYHSVSTKQNLPFYLKHALSFYTWCYMSTKCLTRNGSYIMSPVSQSLSSPHSPRA